MTYHSPVLLEKSIEGLNIHPEGIYVDATFGGGGHSKEILKFLNNGKLYAFDQDFTTIQNKLRGFVGNCFRKYYDFKFLRKVFERKQSLSLLIYVDLWAKFYFFTSFPNLFSMEAIFDSNLPDLPSR